MAGADALLWTIDRDPVLRSTIVAVLVLDHAPAPEEMRHLFTGLVEVIPRLHWRGVRPGLVGIPHWTHDEGFDLDQHIHRMAAPAPGTLDTVLDLAQAMAGQAFDRALPLWEALCVEGLEHARAALVVKVHHAVVDGIGGLAALLAVTEGRAPSTGDGSRPGLNAGSQRSASPPPGALARRWAGAAARLGLRPRAAVAELLHDAATIGRLLAPAPVPRSPLLRGRGILRRFGVHDVSLPDLRRAGEALGGTVNDVFVAGVLGGLERYHELHGQPVEELRGLIPVSIRRGGDPIGKNRFVPVRFVFPAAVTDPGARLRKGHEVLSAPVHDPALRLSDAVAAVLARMPAELATAAFGSMLKGNDFVATNVPGPRSEVLVGGARLQRVYAFSPPTGAALNVSLVSLGRHACLGVNVDTAAVPDPALLLECLRAAFDEMARLGRPVRTPNREYPPWATS